MTDQRDPCEEVEALYFRRDSPGSQRQKRCVIGELPLTIELLGGRPDAPPAPLDSYTIMRTPGDDEDLAMGFLWAEGMISGADDVLALERCAEGQVVRVVLCAERTPSHGAQRNLVVNSSCGLCGRAGIDGLVGSLEAVPAGIAIDLSLLYRLGGEMRAEQALFSRTGGAHAAGLFDAHGVFRLVAEDLGRHSAFDKVLGRALRRGVPTGELGAMLSGRTSLEMVVKAARARIGLLIAVSAPSAAAVAACSRLGITLCGFARGDELAVYCHEQRIRR